ncbi:hypothetical protein [Flavobacterium crassostreae]|uniref:Uncharacterized protein n=1 Tax=Flavobacterium crassostreae TaxID=1763534 RepID=A0A1B9DXI6_9FLAO|nr:hypothetical protein [Flavobacterium crassostreae]OCB74395.1 hypothetical protein LPBF_10375 [Flavobacterium crassostreae]
MIKKLVLLGLIVAQFTTSCSSDNTEILPENASLNDQIANLIKQPYSKLTPAEQKVKLEAEANAMLVEMDHSKTSGAIEAIQNLENLLNVSSVAIFNNKNNNQITDVLNVAGTYGIYTWNNTTKAWIKTASSSELKFIFPAKANQTTNNATLVSKAVESTVKVKIIDTYGQWNFDTYTYSQDINDEIFLPTSVDAILTIDNVQAAIFTTKATYSNGKETPDESSFKMVLSDGYTYEMSGKKGDSNSTQSAFTYKNKNLVKYNFGSTAKIDALLQDDALTAYRGKANGLVELMDNFIIVADTDLAGLADGETALEKSLTNPSFPDYADPKADFKAYYTAKNSYNLKLSEGNAANYNKNTKLILVSKKEGTKIADVVMRSEKGYSQTNSLPVWVANSYSTNGGYWSWNNGASVTTQNYDETLYLKFNDNTEVEMSAYFSTGFDTLEKKFEEFLKSFEK